MPRLEQQNKGPDMGDEEVANALQQFDENGEVFFQDPAYFQKLVGPAHGFRTPYWYQPEVMRDNSRFITIRKGRQIGATTTMADKMLFELITQPDMTGLVFSKGERQAKWGLQKVEEAVKNTILANQLETDKSTYLEFDNGSELYALPSGNAGDQVRGLTADYVWATEAAFVPDKVFEAIEPVIFKSGGSLWLESTPLSTQGRFYRSHNDDLFSKYHISSEHIPDIGNDMLAKWRKNYTKATYKREVLGEFVSQDNAFFEEDLLKRAITRNATTSMSMDEISKKRSYHLGLDPSRKGDDETVFVVVEYLKGAKTYRVREIKSNQVTKGPKLKQTVRDMHDKYNFDSIWIDEGGLGGYAVDDLQKGTPAKGLTFTNENKEDLYLGLRDLFENERIEIPDNTEAVHLWRQLVELEETWTSNNNRRITHPDGGHDDHPDALALAVYGAKKSGGGVMHSLG